MTFKVLESGGTVEYIPGAQQPVGVGGSEKFKLPNEILGYAGVLVRAWLHRTGAARWFRAGAAPSGLVATTLTSASVMLSGSLSSNQPTYCCAAVRRSR